MDDVDQAKQVAGRLLARITEPIVVGERTLHVGASFGVVIFDREAEIPRLSEIHRLADAAMLRAKFSDGGGRRAREARGARGEGRIEFEIFPHDPTPAAT